MRGLTVASLFLSLWLVEHSHGNSSLGHNLNNLHTQFGISLYQTLTETENSSNLMVSPASVSLSLGLLQLGARGNTLAQLQGTLGYDINDPRVQEVLSQPQGDLGNFSDGVWLQLSNALFVQSGVKVLSEFTHHALGWGNSSLVKLNFSNPSHTRSRLQQWTRYTHAAEEFLQAREPHMALLSTVVFHGAWQKQFLFTDTQNLPFTLSNGSTVKVPMMYQSTEVSFGQFRLPSDQEYTVLELPYLDHSLRLLVVLPTDRKTPLSLLESQLSARAVGMWESRLRRTKMDIFLPRFKMHSRFNLKAVLQSLGIHDVFSPSAADFRGISDGNGLFVSEAFHEAQIEVTEAGTKAASATAMVLLKRSRSPVFKADRPFLFILKQINTGSLLFIGRVSAPTETVRG